MPSQRGFILGAAGGIAATVAMTAAMRILFRRLQPEKRYPLPPREIIERVLGPAPNIAKMTVEAHLAYGAAAGGLYSLFPARHVRTGALYGVAVWLVSYLGWIPALSILAPASQHPASRNQLMLLAHLVWGAALAANLRQLEGSQEDVFAAGPIEDRPRPREAKKGRLYPPAPTRKLENT